MNSSKSVPFITPNKRPTTAFPRADREMTSITTTQQEYQQQLQKNNLPFLDFIDPLVLKKKKQEIVRKKYEQLLEKIQFYDADQPEDQRQYRYSKETLMPYLLFTKYMARKPDLPEGEVKQSKNNRLKVWIPDTIVLNDDNFPPMWFYSSPDGHVYRTDSFTSKSVAAKLSNYASPDELVAVVKKIQFRDQLNIAGNQVKLVSSRDLLTTVTNTFQVREPTVIQKFIKSNGPKAFICRTVWRKDRNPYCWIITNKSDFYSEEKIPEQQKYITNPNIMNSCTIVNTCRGKYVDETVPYIKNILKYLHNNLNIGFKEFICDFIKDESGIWWMVNVKGFVFDDPIPEEINTKKILNYGDDMGLEVKEDNSQQNKNKYQKVKICKYCETVFPENELCHKMTLKMIIQTDKHLLHRSKNFPWLARSDIKHVDTPLLYQEHKVCKTCYTLYTETEKLIQQEYQFAKLLGIPCNEETKYNLVSLNQIDQANGGADNSDLSGMQKQKPEEQDDGNWVLDIAPNTQLVVKNNQPKINNKVQKQLDRYRMMILLHYMRDIPIEREDYNKNYFIEYTIFDQKVKYKLDLQNALVNPKDNTCIVGLNKIRICYFFTNGRKGINSYIHQKQVLTMNLYCDQQKIGVLDLELQDFLSDKVNKREYYKVFSGKTLPILKWGLNLTVGMFNAGLIDVSRIKLSEHEGIYLPHGDYYTCEPLPAEWIQIINEKKDLNSIKNKMTYLKNTYGANTPLDRSTVNTPSYNQKQRGSQRSHQQAQSQFSATQPNFNSALTPLQLNQQNSHQSLQYTNTVGQNTNKNSSSQFYQQHLQQPQSTILSELSPFGKEVKFYPSQHSQFANNQNQDQYGTNDNSSYQGYNSSNQQENFSNEETRLFDEILKSEINQYSKEETQKKKKLKKKIYY
ncbi:Lmbr1-like motif protein (macronuclear) [Tetrahymena thermophila SB210]|uniref:Lmbr1-like motif protein n=1 Tax=Tetrahymena thermophila (strain SB210) TaxID=312017 RepID=I7MGS3_TETTS|nr:Lmbr1-like motif protein [Tetrahymena thermophila SB210]EAS01971.2 Lmbr1-like motif protein [Tetrahymena thermophila SB210]|eukprot:XP_001022216.2 Lmbr1-like motif protein [Tetrahymena thermophila SB210]